MLLPGAKIWKIDLKDAYLAIPLSVYIQKVCQIPVEAPSFRVLLPLLPTFFCSSGLYKVAKSPFLCLEQAQSKNNNLHALNGIFVGGLVDDKEYTDIHTWTLKVSYQYQKVLPRADIDFRISRGDSKFCGNVFEPSWRESPESIESMQGIPRKQFVIFKSWKMW